MTTTFSSPAAGPVLAGASDPGLPRILGESGRAERGPTLIVIGGLHGNEPAGVAALQNHFSRLGTDASEPQGRLVGIAGNLQALAGRRRFVDDDLNRIWTRARLESVRADPMGVAAEDRELAELDTILTALIEGSDQPVFVLDLHTTSGPGPAFSVLHDTLMNRRFARALPIPIALGLEEELNGTLTDYLTQKGVIALTVETGQHDDPHSIERAEAAIWIAMEVAGCLPPDYREELVAARRLLEGEGDGLPAAVEVRYRYAIPDRSSYSTDIGLTSFQRVKRGDRLAAQGEEAITTPMAGLLLMPLYQELGDDGFFIARPIRSLWLSLSTVLRRLRVERILQWLPGIEAVEARQTTFLVNRLVARWLALEIFHLLGYRRREHSSTHLLMERRAEPALRS